MTHILGKGELPDATGNWRSGNPSIFNLRKETVECEDIAIAASLLSHGYKYVDRKIVKDYAPGKFAGTLLGRVKDTGFKVFVFVIQGDPLELFERRNLFHCGAHLVDPMEFQKNRAMLIGAMKDAKTKSEIVETGRAE
jgi:hypothetical protein